MICVFESATPMELDVSSMRLRAGHHIEDWPKIQARFGELVEATKWESTRETGEILWLIANATGIRFDVHEPRVRIYMMRPIGTSWYDIERARKAVIREFDKLYDHVEHDDAAA